MSEQVTLTPVDAAYVTVLVDNYHDTLLPSTEVAVRPALRWDLFAGE